MAAEETGVGTGTVHSTAQSRRDLVRMLVIGALCALGGIALALAVDWFPIPASEEAKQIDTVWDVMLIASVPIFVLVEVVVVYCVIRFRMRPGQEDQDGPPIHGNTRVEVIWTAIPAILLFGLCAYSYAVLTDIEDAEANEMQVRVVGEQFTWTFYYDPDGSGPKKEIASNQLYLPIHRQVKFNVQSKDVIHDFWIPAFRLKIDAVPGITGHWRATPNRIGTYPVVCAELCGLGHAAMRQTAHVVSDADFKKWVQSKQQGAAAPSGGGGGGGGGAASAQGKQLFDANGCGACHTLADAGSSGTAGPVLDDALKGKDAAFIKQSIEDPDAVIAKGFGKGIMPGNFKETLSADEIDALVQYLVQVTR